MIDWNRETDRGDWYPDWARRARLSSADEDEILVAWLRMCLEADDVTFPAIAMESDPVNRRAELIKTWLNQRLILVSAEGSQGRGRWVSAPAFLTGPGFSSINAEIELYDRIAEENAWDDHVGEPFLTPFGKMADGRTISCASHFGMPALDVFQRSATAAQHDRLLDVAPVLHDLAQDVDERTQSHLHERINPAVTSVNSAPSPSPQLVARVRELETRANFHFSGVLQDAPTLRLHVDPIGFGHRVEWFVANDTGGLEVDDESTEVSIEVWERERRVAELSAAQRRWAHWSIEMAVHDIERPDVASDRLILVDEPEAALHRSAEARMADYLSTLATDGSTQLLLATHSPELLDLNAASVYEIARRNGRRRLSQLTSVAREDMDELGLLPSDLLRRQRGFILVEGLHDEVVLDELFGDELRRQRVEPLPMRGTTELSPAKIAFLFEYTPAHVFVLLDNVMTAELSDAWGRVLELTADGQLDAAQEALSSAASLNTDEGKKLRKVLTEVVLDGQAARLTPFGLTAADVIEYLPVEVLVPGGTDWRALRERHRVSRETSKKTPKDFKTWLKIALDADFSQESVRAAVQRLDHIPPDLLRLLKTIEAHAQPSDRIQSL
ncbi:ATP-dependent nuclease [Nocardioides iriomotensis]|uniref:ATPase AAA-type core domain-containing protein n=1 Tax=Nocardioides iriomotensis TaxID=715784 RepID=A0A4Q5JA07_9ACTN|nr:AAA family ATPase [Nocardioides iriomotensis]RYU15550.1 hypothetical protein ETU37_00045 [Nocardioides iriomotensis]